MAPKIVLISGCSSGMGLVTAVHLAQDDEKRFKVYATMRNLAKKGQLEEEGKECVGDTLIIKQMDVCSDESVEKAVKQVLDTEGRIDVLFNNAGVSLVSLLEWTSISKAKDIFEVNFYGPLRLIQAVLPSMKAKQSGHIINTTSTIGVIGLPFLDIYAASKFAVEGMTESMAPVLRQFNIRCTILEPGPVKTPMMQGSADAGGELDLSAADQKTQALMKTWGDITSQWFNSTLTASDVAAMIKDIILGKITSFRCQANAEPFMKGMIAAKLKDVASNEPVDMAAQKLSGGN